jgi:hypothetical protein
MGISGTPLVPEIQHLGFPLREGTREAPTIKEVQSLHGPLHLIIPEGIKEIISMRSGGPKIFSISRRNKMPKWPNRKRRKRIQKMRGIQTRKGGPVCRPQALPRPESPSA